MDCLLGMEELCRDQKKMPSQENLSSASRPLCRARRTIEALGGQLASLVPLTPPGVTTYRRPCSERSWTITFGCSFIVTKPLPQKVSAFFPVVFSPCHKARWLLFLLLLTVLAENTCLHCLLSEVFHAVTILFHSFLPGNFLSLAFPQCPSKGREPALTFEH